MQQVLTEDYVRTARSKGLPGRAILARHVLRNAALPIVTTIGMAFGYAITGAFVVEVIFNIPGMARVAIDRWTVERATEEAIQRIKLIRATYK